MAGEIKKPVALPLSEARKIYVEEKVFSIIDKKNFGDIVDKWPYYDKNHNIIGMDIYFEKSKRVIPTFWYDGKNLNIKQSPTLIYNLPACLITEKPILIVKFPKFVESTKDLNEFTACSWNGGFGKEMIAPWEQLKDKEVFCYLGDHKSSISVASNIKKILPQLKAVKLVEDAKKYKKKGSNIEEALKYMPPEEFTKYILNIENHYSTEELSKTGPGSSPTATQNAIGDSPPPKDPGSFFDDSTLPFKILGIGDDGKAAFITEAKRFVKYGLDSLSKSKLMVLAGRWFWRENYSSDGKMSWDWAIDEIIRFSQNKDFDENNIRGRGAWRDGDKISYHDGKNTYGDFDKNKIYLRLPHHDIGINDSPASKEVCQAIKNTVFKLSFDTPADAVRAMSWAVLAPFAGALKFRPAILFTGPSGTGKTTIANLFINKIALPWWINGNESSAAYIYQTIKKDSGGITIDEAEGTDEKGKKFRNDQLSLMRASTSDNAPDSGKGGKDGIPITYKMKCMFMFFSVDPTIEKVADENRIFRINSRPPTNGGQWKEIEKTLLGLLSEKNCRGVRALTWKKLKIIFNLAERIVDAIRQKTGKDYRSSYADALLSSAFMVVWTGTDSPTDEQIDEMLTKYYKFQPPEEHRDEAEEFIDRILEEQIEVLHDNSREKISILECMNRICTDGHLPEDEDTYFMKLDNYRKTLSRYGIRADGKQIETGQVAIANNHHMIKKITGHNTGYNRIFQRLKGFIDGNKTVYFLDGKNRRATIIRGLLLKKDFDEEVEELIF